MTYHYLMDLALILLSTKVLGILTKRIQMPQVVGALVAGLILGPAMLNVLSETEFLTQLSELGVIVLMFSAGMGTDIQELKHSGKAGFLVALLGVIVPLVLGTGLAMFADRTGMIETSGFLEDVFIGTILTATSVSITVETLKEIGKLDTKVGNTILAAALIDDVLGLIALTIVSSLSGGQDSIALVLLKIVLFFVFSAVVSFLAHKFFCWLMALWPGRERRRYPVLAFVLCLLMAYCAEEFFGVADITGAYVAGLVLSNLRDSHDIERRLDVNSYTLFGPLFFASVGISTDISAFDTSILAFSLAFLVVGLLSKIVGCGLMAWICRFKKEDALKIGVGMMNRGEVALIVSQKGLAVGLMNAAYFPAVILLIIVSAVVTPIALKVLYSAYPDAPAKAA